MSGLRAVLAVLDLEFDPVGVGFGAGAFQLIRPTGCRGPGPLSEIQPLVFPEYEDGLRQAWATVISRLEENVASLGAHGVVGVTVSRSWSVGAPATMQLRLAGTALRLRDYPLGQRPFLSTLSMEEFLKLLAGGWVPAGIVWGVAAVHVHGWAASPLRQGTYLANSEMAAPTAGMQLARDRLDQQARAILAACGGQGAVNVGLSVERHPNTCGASGKLSQQAILVDGSILGTAIVRYREPTRSALPALSLSRKGPATRVH